MVSHKEVTWVDYLGGVRVGTGRPVGRLMVTDLGVWDWGPAARYGRRWLVSLPGG